MQYHLSLLVVGAMSALPLAAQARDSAAAASTYVVRGTVTNSAGDLLTDAEVGVLDADRVTRRVRSDERGTFLLDRLKGPLITLRARRVGYEAVTTTVRFDGKDTVASIHIALDPVVAKLAATDISASALANDGKLQGFFDRARNNKFGRYFNQEQIDASRRTRVSELLRGLPGVTIIPARLGAAVRFRGCRPSVWVDGVHMPGAEIDDVTSLADIAAIEEYASWAGLPPQFQDRSNVCGALVLWTRDGA